MFDIVFYEPEIPPNTGNIIRLCANTGTRLHLIEPLGFPLDEKQVKRAGLDYWQHVDLHIWPDFDGFMDALAPAPQEICLFTKRGSRLFWDLPPLDRLFLVFGAETMGLPPTILNRFQGAHFAIPMAGPIRSLNLSTAVGIALYESLRNR